MSAHTYNCRHSKFAVHFHDSDHRIRIPPSFPTYVLCPFDHKILPCTTLHSHRAIQQLQTNLLSPLSNFSDSAVTSSLLQLPVNNKFLVPYNNCPSVYVLTNAPDNLFPFTNTYKCPPYNTKFSRLSPSPTTKDNKRKSKLPALNLHSDTSPASGLNTTAGILQKWPILQQPPAKQPTANKSTPRSNILVSLHLSLTLSPSSPAFSISLRSRNFLSAHK